MLASLDRYLDDELPDAERLAFERELADDPALSAELGLRRAAMTALEDWAGAPCSAPQHPARPATRRLRLVLAAAIASAAAVLLLVAGAGDRRSGPATVRGRLVMRQLDSGVSFSPDGELVTDPFPITWRTLRDGVRVIPGSAERAEELVVDPFPEEGN
jgi:anti-sigma factor RsiW